MKRQQKHFKRLLKNNKTLAHHIENLYRVPVSQSGKNLEDDQEKAV